MRQLLVRLTRKLSIFSIYLLLFFLPLQASAAQHGLRRRVPLRQYSASESSGSSAEPERSAEVSSEPERGSSAHDPARAPQHSQARRSALARTAAARRRGCRTARSIPAGGAHARLALAGGSRRGWGRRQRAVGPAGVQGGARAGPQAGDPLQGAGSG